MDLSLWTGPVGIAAAGLSVFVFPFLLFRGRSRSHSQGSDGDRTRQLESMIEKLRSEKEEVTLLLNEANQATSHLRHMIDSFERTFYSENPEDDSVSETFNGLRREMRRQCRELGSRSYCR